MNYYIAKIFGNISILFSKIHIDTLAKAFNKIENWFYAK